MPTFLDNNLLLSPWLWALVSGTCALGLLVPRGRMVRWQMALGGVLGIVSIGLLAAQLPILTPVTAASLFWLIGAVTVVSAAAMISMRSPVYCAIWFAMALLGTSCLFLLQGAQLLAVATIVVYAGAIVVMFLFLIMLAQPEGQEFYDRISWSSPAALASSLAGAAIVLLMTMTIVGLGQQRANLQARIAKVLPQVVNSDGETVWQREDIQRASLNRNDDDEPHLTVLLRTTANEESVAALQGELAMLEEMQRELPDGQTAPADGHQILIEFVDEAGTQSAQHVANLGGVLFSRYLIAVEVAGTLLLIALVGAIAIIMHGRETEGDAGQLASPRATGAEGGRA